MSAESRSPATSDETKRFFTEWGEETTPWVHEAARAIVERAASAVPISVEEIEGLISDRAPLAYGPPVTSEQEGAREAAQAAGDYLRHREHQRNGGQA